MKTKEKWVGGKLGENLSLWEAKTGRACAVHRPLFFSTLLSNQKHDVLREGLAQIGIVPRSCEWEPAVVELKLLMP